MNGQHLRTQSILLPTKDRQPARMTRFGRAARAGHFFDTLICKVVHLSRTPCALHCPHTLRAIERQESLGSDALLRGFHHVEWVYTLQSTWIPLNRYDDGTMEKK
jgi:hypothetical protein